MASTPRKVPVVAPTTKGALETAEQKVGQDHPRFISGEGELHVTPPEIEAVGEFPGKKKLDDLKFMEDVLTIMVPTTTDKAKPPLVKASNSGINQFIFRGRPQTVKRKYVESLARAKKTDFESHSYIDSETREAVNRMTPNTALSEDFSVIHDPAGDRGRAWLESVLAEA